MPAYRFTLTEHDPERPWLVVGTEHRMVTLADEAAFFAWAAEHWPAPRWTVQQDPHLSDWPREDL